MQSSDHGCLNNTEGNTYIFVETLSGFEVSNKCFDYIKIPVLLYKGSQGFNYECLYVQVKIDTGSSRPG